MLLLANPTSRLTILLWMILGWNMVTTADLTVHPQARNIRHMKFLNAILLNYAMSVFLLLYYND